MINDNSNNKGNKKSPILLILSILNALTIVPFVFLFLCVWLIFGGLSDDPSQAHLIAIGCLSYIVISILFLIYQILRSIPTKKGKIIFMLILSGIVLLIVGLIPVSQRLEQERIKNLELSISEEDNDSSKEKLFNNDDIKISLVDAEKDKYKYSYTFELSNYSQIYYSFEIDELYVNSKKINFGTSSSSNFNIYNAFVSPNIKSKKYNIYIWENDLEAINEIKINKLDMKIHLRYTDNVDNVSNYQEEDIPDLISVIK